MEKITITRNPNDVPLDKNLYHWAKEEGITFSALLEKINPSESNDELDAFERQLKRFGIIVKGNPDKGVYPSTGALFFQSNVPASTVLFPEFIEKTIRTAMMDETDYLSLLVDPNNWTTSNAGTFRSLYVDDTATTRKSGRRGEGAKPAKMTVTWSEKAVTMADYAIEVDMSYEFVRWAALPMIQTILRRAALQRRYDEASEAITVIESGDGSGKEGDAAVNTNLGDLQTAKTGTKDVEYKSWLNWLAKFSPYQASTVMGYITDVIDIICMAKPSTDPVFMYELLNKSQTGGVPQVANLGLGNITLLHHGDITTNKLLAIDRRFALQGYRDMGMDMVETNRLIDAKWEQIVISNRVGFAKMFTNSCRKLTTNA